MAFTPTHRIGLVTPSSNPAYEPEMRALLPDRIAVHATRLPVMPGTTLQERNSRYIPAYSDAIASFGTLALNAFAIGLTGPSYALSPEEDRGLQARLFRQAGRPVILPTLAISLAMERAGLRRALIFSAYPGWLTDRAEVYWQAAGIDVVDVFKVSDVFRAYELTTAEVVAALGRISVPDDAAVIMSGTGMSSLDALDECQAGCKALLLPSNLATAFAVLRLLRQHPSDAFRKVSPRLAAAV